MHQPKITVIVPAYNVEKHIERCLSSIIYQTFTDFYVVVVNDGSTDGTLDIINQYAEKDSRIKLINQDNQGASVARNVGFQASISDFVTFVDSDDFLALDALDYLYQHISKYNNDYVIGAKKKINATAETSNFLPSLFVKDIGVVSSEDIEYLQKIRFHIAPHAKLIRRSFLDQHEISWIEKWVYEDFLYSYTLLLTAKSIGVVSHNCYFYCFNESSVSNTPLTKHNIMSRWEVEKSLWEVCSEKDTHGRVFKNPQVATFSWGTRFYSHVVRIGLEDNELHREAFDIVKHIIGNNLDTIMQVTSGTKKLIYLALYSVNFERFVVFRQGLESLDTEVVHFEDGMIFLADDWLSEFSLNLEDRTVGKYKIEDVEINDGW